MSSFQHSTERGAERLARLARVLDALEGDSTLGLQLATVR